MSDYPGPGEWPPDLKPKFGLLPAIPDRPVMMLQPLVALPSFPPEVHNLELIADPDMLGNGQYGDCVAVSIENDRRASRAALGLPLNKMSAKQVVANYFIMTGGPDSGLVTQLALEWAHRNGWGGDHLLCFARVSHTHDTVRQTVNEFHSGVYGMEIDASEQYASSYWNADNTTFLGWHATAGGTYTPDFVCVKTWGYIARMTPTYLSKKVSEFYVLVWDFEWDSLSYERQVQLVADYSAVTQNVWTGPAPTQAYEPRSAVNKVSIDPVRIIDSRKGGGRLAAGVARKVQVAGVAGIPAGVTSIAGNLTIVNPSSAGNAAVLPVAKTPATSTVNFHARNDTANAFDTGLASDGSFVIVSTSGADFIVDVTAYFTE